MIGENESRSVARKQQELVAPALGRILGGQDQGRFGGPGGAQGVGGAFVGKPGTAGAGGGKQKQGKKWQGLAHARC